MAALRISDDDLRRRNKIAGMLGSAHDGERLNALAMLQRMADVYRVQVHELLLANGGTESSFDRQRVEQAERRAREAEAELRAQRAGQGARAQHPAEPPPDAPELSRGWRDRLTEAQAINGSRPFLTAWEAGFAADLIARGTRWPSPKQSIVILKIIGKAKTFGAASAGADWEDVP